ncbi:ATP-binding protein [Mesorhizobium sp. M1307]|uniref:sensor histidine kinase n=1 Tax=Mesorhizobium sp. M1307 TaxID=2957079 RepID=UPI00333CFC0D
MSRYAFVAAIVLATGIFIFDTLTPLNIAVAVLYVAVVLLSLNFTNRRGTLLVGAGCMGLTILSFAITHSADFEAGATARGLFSLAAIGVTTFLALRLASTITVIADSEQRYRSIFRAAGVAILEMDFSALKARLEALRAEGFTSVAAIARQRPDLVGEVTGLMRLINANDRTLTMFRAPTLAVFAQRLPSLIPPEIAPSTWRLLEAIWSEQSSFETESVFDTVDGKRLNVLYTVAMPTDRPALDRVLVSFMDVTARHQAENDLHQAQAELAHVSRVATLGELTVSIAHEVNQPLAGVVTNGEAGLRWLRRPEPDLAEVSAAIERMIADARRASEVIKRLRALASKAVPQAAPVDVNELVHDTLGVVQREIAGHQVSLKLALADGLPPALGDRVQLQQVLINLIVNAIQAMAATGTTQRDLTIRSRPTDTGLSVEITDTGPGFSSDAAAKLFTPFFTTKDEGMGMGLPICRSIVEAHGGTLRAHLLAEGGAAFEFNLPAHTETQP